MQSNSTDRSFHDRLDAVIARAGSPICVGLDPDPGRFPQHLGDPHSRSALLGFVEGIIGVTRDLVAAYKPNLAFFEAYGAVGWEVLELLHSLTGPEVLLIADAKRGDVDHTNQAYAESLFGRLQADAVTVQPYLGGEPLKPFCQDPRKGMFVLCATSNPGAREIQELQVNGHPLYIEVAKQARTWSEHPNVGLVIGTTKPEALEQVLEIAPDLPLLLPGGGAQGGKTKDVLSLLTRQRSRGLFTFSRNVLYASSGTDFTEAARAEVLKIRDSLR